MNQLMILLRGPIGAGKTTTMTALREYVPNSSVIEVDALKRMIDPTQSSEWRREVSLKTAVFLAGSLLDVGRTVIAEVHAHDMRQRAVFRHMAETRSAPFLSFLLKPTLEVCLERAQNRHVPGISYEIDTQMVSSHYEGIQQLPDEPVLGAANSTPEEIAMQIAEICFLSTSGRIELCQNFPK